MNKNQKIITSKSFKEARKNRFKKFFRYDNSEYWLEYYSKKLINGDTAREKLYAKIISNHVDKNAKVVDMACGIGFLLKELKKIGLRPEGVDLFPDMISSAEEYLKDSSIKIYNCDILSVPFSKESIDCISLISILEHFPLIEVVQNILPKMTSLLKTNGYLFVHCPVKTPTSVFTRFLRKYISRDLPEWAIDDDADITHKIWMAPKEYIKMIEQQGYNLINFDSRLTRSNMKPEFLSNIMSVIEKISIPSDPLLKRAYKDERDLVKYMKLIKREMALTSYFLFKKR